MAGVPFWPVANGRDITVAAAKIDKIGTAGARIRMSVQ